MIQKEKPNNFLKECYGSSANEGNLRSINDNDIERMINCHCENGYIAISACRGADFLGIDKKKHEADFNRINWERSRELIKFLIKSKFSYTPVFGGFVENQGEANEEIVYECAFIVYCEDRNGRALDFEELYGFGLAMGKLFNQDTILVQAPGDCPKYVSTQSDTFGEVIRESHEDQPFNKLCQDYFSDLHKWDMNNSAPTRVSFYEAYVNPNARSYQEGHCRWARGERFLHCR